MAPMKTPAQEQIGQHLLDALEGLRKDVTRVEIWATALRSFSKPIPDYEIDPEFELGKSATHTADTRPNARKNRSRRGSAK